MQEEIAHLGPPTCACRSTEVAEYVGSRVAVSPRRPVAPFKESRLSPSGGNKIVFNRSGRKMHRRSFASKGTFANGEPAGRASVCALLIQTRRFASDNPVKPVRGWWFVARGWWFVVGGWRFVVGGWRLQLRLQTSTNSSTLSTRLFRTKFSFSALTAQTVRNSRKNHKSPRGLKHNLAIPPRRDRAASSRPRDYLADPFILICPFLRPNPFPQANLFSTGTRPYGFPDRHPILFAIMTA